MSRASRTRDSREFDPEAGSVYGGFGVAALTLDNREERPAGGRNASGARTQSPLGAIHDRQ